MEENIEIINNIQNNFNISTNTDESNNINIADSFLLKKKKLIEISKNLSNFEYLEIFNIIKEDNYPYTENKNGIFINLQNISETTIDKIFNFINFIKHKKKELVIHEEIINNTRKNLIENNKSIIENNNDDDNIENINYSDDESIKNNNYLTFSSDEDDDLENKISLKKKKIKYSGKKAQIIKSIKESGDLNKFKNRNKKND